MFRRLSFVCALITVLLVSSAVAASPAAGGEAGEAGERVGTLTPLSSLLNPDGTLDLSGDFEGSLDPAGWRMHTGPGGEPRFVRESSVAVPIAGSKWDDRFGHAGVDYKPFAVAVSGANVYVGGIFSKVAGGIQANGIAKWNGRRWSALGEGIKEFGAAGRVHAIAVSGSKVYAAGKFNRAGGVDANSIAMWNGTSWSALDTGVVGYYGDLDFAYAVAVEPATGAVWVGGSFDQAGGSPAKGIAKWNGTSWSEPGGGVLSLAGGSAGTVRTVTVGGGVVYIGGVFEVAGTTTVNSVAKWTGTAWAALAGGVLSEFGRGEVNDIAVNGAKVYVAGEFVQAGTTPAANIAVFDGTAWSALAGGIPSSNGVDTIALSNGVRFAGGDFSTADTVAVESIAKWKAGRWSAVSVPGVDAPVLDMAPNGVYGVDVVGDFDTAGRAFANGVARWNGIGWWTFGRGVSSGPCCGSVNAVITDLAGNVYAGGFFSAAGNLQTESIARWDGIRWNRLGAGGVRQSTTEGRVHALAMKGDVLYVGGDFVTAGGVSANNIAKWNRVSGAWSALGTGTNGPVHSLEFDGNMLYVGGNFFSAGPTDATRVARWNTNTNTWSRLGTHVEFLEFGDAVNAIAVSGNLVFLGGTFASIYYDGVQYAMNGIVLWDKVIDEWYYVGNGVTISTAAHGAGDVHALEPHGGKVCAGGDFDTAWNSTAVSIAARGVACWDLVNLGWSALGAGISGGGAVVRSLAADGTNLFAGGDFVTAGTAAANALARWDGTSWYGLAGGMTNDDMWRPVVSAMSTGLDSLWAGGDFLTAGGIPSYNFGRWGGPARAAIALEPNTGRRGSAVTVTAEGFQAGEGVDLTFIDPAGNVALGTKVANSVGGFTTKVFVPATATLGLRTIEARGATSLKVATATYKVI